MQAKLLYGFWKASVWMEGTQAGLSKDRHMDRFGVCGENTAHLVSGVCM